MLLYSTLLCKKIASEPGGHKRFMLTRLVGGHPLFFVYRDFQRTKKPSLVLSPEGRHRLSSWSSNSLKRRLELRELNMVQYRNLKLGLKNLERINFK